MIPRRAAACLAALVFATAALGAHASPPREGFPADPAPRASEKQWVFDLAYDNGASVVTSARSTTAKTPLATPRVTGRFALEFWVGKELLDRIRFNVPLLGDDTAYRDTKGFFKKPTFQRVTTKLKVQMADNPRATVLAFVDRATGDVRKYFWPPDEKGHLTPFSAKAATTEAPPTATGAPAAGSSVPVAGTSAPVAGTSVPVAGTSAPVAGASAPVAGASAPVAGASAPVAGASAPVAGTSTPVAPSSAPAANTAAPGGPASPKGPPAPANTAAPGGAGSPKGPPAPANTAAPNKPPVATKRR